MRFKPDLDDQLVSFNALTLLVWSSCLQNRPRNDLLCVEWDVKPYTLIHSPSLFDAPGTEVLALQINNRRTNERKKKAWQTREMWLDWLMEKEYKVDYSFLMRPSSPVG